MTIELVTIWNPELGRSKKGKPVTGIKPEAVLKIINSSEADLLVFPGWTIDQDKANSEFENSIKNTSTFVVLETICSGEGLETNVPTVIKKGKLKKGRQSQLFAESADINQEPGLFDEFLNTFQKERIYKHKGKHIGIIVCGENNILKNLQGDGNRVVLRSDSKKEKAEFLKALKNLDIIVNYTHVQQLGNQGKYQKRREFLSNEHRVYCTTTNFSSKKEARDRKYRTNKTLQYCFYNGEPVNGKIIVAEKRYMVKQYKL